MDTYPIFMPYFIIGLLHILIVLSIVTNRRNRLVMILSVSFIIDIVIHCILQFGLKSAYIYGGHFIFIYPLLLGWLFYSLREKQLLFTFSFGIFLLVFVFTFANNICRIVDFFKFITLYYQ